MKKECVFILGALCLTGCVQQDIFQKGPVQNPFQNDFYTQDRTRESQTRLERIRLEQERLRRAQDQCEQALREQQYQQTQQARLQVERQQRLRRAQDQCEQALREQQYQTQQARLQVERQQRLDRSAREMANHAAAQGTERRRQQEELQAREDAELRRQQEERMFELARQNSLRTFAEEEERRRQQRQPEPSPVQAVAPEQAPSQPSQVWEANSEHLRQAGVLIMALQREQGRAPSADEMIRKFTSEMGLTSDQARKILESMGLL